MIADITGISLLPSALGSLCPGNGLKQDKNGNPIECCCDECDYMLECFPEYDIAGKKQK